MGFFNIFKKKNKIDFINENSVMDYVQKYEDGFMMERLLSYAILMKCAFMMLDKHNEYLNTACLQHDSDLLFELQM